MNLFKNTCFLSVIIVISVCHSQFSGGSGTAEDPWLIRTPENLDSIRYFLGSVKVGNCYKQIADIDLGVAPWNDGAGWEPLGNDSLDFIGNYDGNGFKIINLTINRPGEDNIGLYGNISSSMLVNISLTNTNITGKYNVGGLVGYCDSSGIEECCTTGSAYGLSAVGGIVGFCDYVVVLNCFTTADVSGSTDIGGVIGKIRSEEGYGYIVKTYSTGNIAGDSNTGGLIGTGETPNIRFSYWNTETSGQTDSAGGEGRTTDEMTYDYSSDTYKYWDFENIWTEDFENTNSGYPYLLNQLSNLIPSAPANLKAVCQNGEYSVELTWNNPDTLLNGDHITELTAVHVYRNFDLIHTINSPIAGDSENYTDIVPQTGSYTYKVLAVNSEGYGVNARINQPAGEMFVWGSGSESDPYILSSAEELNNVRYYTKIDSVYFRQVDNIDLGVAPWNEGKGWEPIGDYENEFEGSFSGESRYNLISNLTINDSTKNYASLFGVIKNAEIDHVHLQGVDIKGLSACGTLAGAGHNSNISNCSSEYGTVQGFENEVGGLIGSSIDGAISRCFTNVDISGMDNIGGLAGVICENTKVSNCYTKGNVNGLSVVGGLIGANISFYSNSVIENCYSVGQVIGNSNTGGLIGMSDTYPTHSYWDIETSGQLTSAGGEGRMTYEMEYPTYSDSTYVDWDFMNTWIIGWPTKYENYPLLKWQTYVSIEHDDFTPEECKLFQNYPNPFNPATEIRFALAKTAGVKLSVYNISGQKIMELSNGIKHAGLHTVEFDGSKFNSGIYYYTLEVEGKATTKKMILLK